jgi:phage gp29-like protein
MPNPRNVVIEPTSISVLTTWTVASVRHALARHDDGDFYESSLLCEQLRRDPAIFGDLSTRVRALAARSGLPFDVQASYGVDDRRADTVAERVEALWFDLAPEHVLEAIMVDAILLGVAVARIEWRTMAREWVPFLRHLPAHGLRWDDTAKAYRYITGDGQDLVVNPGDGTWFLHAPHGDRSWLWGAVRALGVPWLMRTFTFRDWARYCEKHGMPVLAIKEPFFAHDDVEGPGGTTGASNATAVYSQFRKLGSESVLRLPQGASPDDGGWSAEWIEPKAATFDAFQKFLAELRTGIRSVILGHDTEAGARGGDGELAAQRVKVEYLSADCEPLSTSLRQQVLKPYVVYNVDAARPELAPWPRWDTRPIPDLKGRAEMLDKLGDALAKLGANGVDIGEILQEFQLEPAGVDNDEEEPDEDAFAESLTLSEPPQSVRDEARRGLEWRRKYRRGGTSVGVYRAQSLARGDRIRESTIIRMVAYFARHEVDRDAEGFRPGERGYPSAGRIAWALWGGDAGRAWAGGLAEQIRRGEKLQ